MNNKEYQALALRTCPESSKNLTHAILGISGEVGELFLGNDNFIEEAGDILWFIALGCECLNTNISDINTIERNHFDKKSDMVICQGICSDTLKRSLFYNTELNKALLIEAFGRMIYIISEVVDIEKAMELNIEKLKKRFPDGYSDHHAVNRDLEKESKVFQ